MNEGYKGSPMRLIHTGDTPESLQKRTRLPDDSDREGNAQMYRRTALIAVAAGVCATIAGALTRPHREEEMDEPQTPTRKRKEEEINEVPEQEKPKQRGEIYA